MANASWRALSAGSPVTPASAFSYITRALRQTTPFVVGALRLLAESFLPEELNKRGYYLYADFRPEVSGWGGRGEVRCTNILKQRRKEPIPQQGQRIKMEDVVKVENDDGSTTLKDDASGESQPKRRRGMTLEEYEAALDADDTFASVDLDSLNPQP